MPTYDCRMLRTIAALGRSSHPGPTVAVTAIAIILGIGIGLEPWRLVVVGLMFLTNQLSVGLSNDWIDAERDRAVGRTDKPIAAGVVSETVARNTAFVCAGLAIALSFLLGWPAAIAQFVFLASGWTYNLGLKRTVFSIVPYIVGFATVPSVVTLALPTPAFAAPWVTVVGGVFGAVAHFANALPDLDDDRATGVRGLPQRIMTGRGSRLVFRLIIAGALATVLVLALTGAPLLA